MTPTSTPPIPNYTPYEDSPKGIKPSPIWIDCPFIDAATGSRCILNTGHRELYHVCGGKLVSSPPVDPAASFADVT